MPSKWAKLKTVLDPWKPVESYQDKVDEAKKQYIALSPTELARQFKIEDDFKDEAEAMVKAHNLELEALSQLIVSALTGSNLQALELESGMKVSLDDKIFIGVIDTPEAQAAYSKWSDRPMIKKLKKLYVQTRDGFVREEVLKNMVAGKPMPKEFAPWLELKYKTRAKLTGKKKENSNGGNEDE